MENNKEDGLEDDFIESSQVPTLRPKIRQNRPNYKIHSIPKEPRRAKRKPLKRIRDDKTVSQWLRQVWNNKPQSKPPSATATNAAASTEDYVKFETQQEALNGIEPIPSVSLFHQQDETLARYMFNETIEAQVEAQLEKLLDGFQAEYQQKCAEMERSPVPYADVEHASSLQSTLLPGTSMEPEGIPAKERQKTLSPLAVVSDIIPNFSEEIQRMEEILDKGNPLQSNRSLVPVSVTTTPIIPTVELREQISPIAEANVAMPLVTGNVCFDLSVQQDQSTTGNTNRTLTPKIVAKELPMINRKHSPYLPNAHPPNSPRVFDDVLDLRVTNCQPISHPVSNYSARTIVPNRPPISGTSDCGTQANLRGKRRNVAVQHRPVASFEFTERNIIVLAQQFEADPGMLQRKLSRIAKTSTEAIWRERDLSTAFTAADPYYANLKHFL